MSIFSSANIVQTFINLKSIGATPRQISYLLYLEALAYCIPAIIIGPIVGYIVQSINIKFVFSLPITLICVLCVIVTVMLAVSKEISKLTRLSSVAAISGETERYSKSKFTKEIKKSRPIDPSHPARSLVWQFYRGNRHAYRLSLVALTVFCTLIASFNIFMSMLKANQYSQLDKENYNINIKFGDQLPSDALLTEIAGLGYKYAAYLGAGCFGVLSMLAVG
ncbi:MAG: ABC transporter permease [Clostridiales bacterium]|nr:ABC transporter permease [Clostridiales bacterium]